MELTSLDTAKTVMDHYEKQLYTVFKKFDVDNEEALDEPAVHALCDALQLEERGAALADTLFEGRPARVTFTRFRNGLLAVLGGDRAPSDDDSSGHELAPKFVFGSKKYGRRSRPQRAQEGTSAPRSSSASRLHAEERHPARCRRSASAMETRDGSPEPAALDHDRRVNRDCALQLCRDLRMDGIDQHLVERIFEDSPSGETTVGEFFDRLNAALTSSMGEICKTTPTDEAENMPTETVVGAWERGGVPHARRLLHSLGIRGDAVRPTTLEVALDDEIRARSDRHRKEGLLTAALIVARLHTAEIRKQAESTAAERNKLRGDVVEANERARLLAQEVDERHTRLESELRTALRRAESRHVEELRVAQADATAERERVEEISAQLDTEVARRATVEARLGSEAEELRVRLAEAEATAKDLESRLSSSDRERARLASDLQEIQAMNGAAAAAGAGEVAEQVARFNELRSENQQLRDRCDELAAELEKQARSTQPAAGFTMVGDLSTELSCVLTADSEEGSPAVSGVETSPDCLQRDDLIRELECSLEQMKTEYERCEEYWGGKLREERAAHDEELRLADARLAELVARVADYERQYAAALPPIDERASLEAQVTDLQEEFARCRRDHEAQLAARDHQLRELTERVAARPPCACAALRERCARLAARPPEVRELRARTARAEAAARRLQARLAAADLLVKDLYVENCHLVHRRAL